MGIMQNSNKNVTIDYSKCKGKERNSRQNDLEKELKVLYQLNDEGKLENTNKIQNIENEINDIYKLKAKGAQIR